MKKLCSTVLGFSLIFLSQTIVLAQTATRSATGSGGLPAAGVSWPTVLVTTFGAALIFWGAVKFFKSFN